MEQGNSLAYLSILRYNFSHLFWAASSSCTFGMNSVSSLVQFRMFFCWLFSEQQRICITVLKRLNSGSMWLGAHKAGFPFSYGHNPRSVSQTESTPQEVCPLYVFEGFLKSSAKPDPQNRAVLQKLIVLAGLH